ncbi:hypothetical protein FF1_027955 [Malus domestica]
MTNIQIPSSVVIDRCPTFSPPSLPSISLSSESAILLNFKVPNLLSSTTSNFADFHNPILPSSDLDAGEGLKLTSPEKRRIGSGRE